MLAFEDRQRFDSDLPAEDGELLHGGRAPDVEGRHQDLAFALLREALGDLGG